MAAHEYTSPKVITVSDLDPLMPVYRVVTEGGQELGSKSKTLGYLKPNYDRRGRSRFSKKSGYAEKIYKSTPPWFRRQVKEISSLDIIVKEEDS